MWDQQETRREPLPAGTVLCTMNGQFTIQKYITSGGFALLYQAQEEGQMYPVILKEYFPRQGYVRVGGAILPEEAAALPENDPERKKRIEKMQTLFDERANREIRVGQQSRQRTRLTVPVDRKLSVRSIQLPGKDPCTPPYSCILEMECLTERQGFWLKDLLEEAAQPCSPDHPFGNGRPGCGNSVPQFAKTVDLFCALLANLKRIHSDEDGSGCIHGDISAGNLFVDGSLSDGTILAVSLLDFGSGWDEETGPESEVFSTPGFRAPELQNGGTPTPASDVYAVGRLFYALLDPTAANNLRLERDLSFLERYVTLTASQARPSGLEGSLLAQVNALLTAAAKEAPEERITLEEMARQMDEWRRRLTPPVWSLAQNAGALNDGEVKGRDEDVKNLLNELENEKRNPHVLWGFAGMGKTKLALAAAHGWQQRHPLSRTYFVRFPGTLEALYTDTFAHAMPVERGGPDLIGNVQKLLCENLSELDLLVIDNFDRDEASSWAELTGASGSLEQQLYQQLCALPCRLLLTTRQNLKHAAGGRFFEINSLKEDVLLDILRDGSRGLPDSDDDTLRHILRLIERHTMTVTMVAALMQFTHIPAGQIAEDLSKGQTLRDNSLEMLIPSEKDGESRSGTVLQNLTTLFGLAKLTPPMRTLLHRAMFIGESGLSRELFLNACGLRPDDRDFHALVDLRYLNSTGSGKDEYLVPHTLIRKLCSLREPGSDGEGDAHFLDGLWEFQETPADRRSTADIYSAVLGKSDPDARLDTPQKKLWAYRAASLYFRLADFKKAAKWNNAMIIAEKAQPALHWTLPQLYENRALIFRDRKQPPEEFDAAIKAMECLNELGPLEQNPSAAASIYETLGRAYSDVGKLLLRGVSPEDRETLLELTSRADALAFGGDSAAWADRTEKRDYDDRQRACYEYAARLREERFTFHSSDTFRTYINLAYCAGVCAMRAKNEPERLRQEAARQLRWSRQALEISERSSTGAYSNMGLAYGALGDYAREKEAFETLLVRRRQNSEKGDSRLYELQALLYLIEACKHGGDNEEASKRYKEVQALAKQLGVEELFAHNLEEAGEGLL